MDILCKNSSLLKHYKTWISAVCGGHADYVFSSNQAKSNQNAGKQKMCLQHKQVPFCKGISWASYQIRKIAGCACAGNAGNVVPPPLVSDPDMHHGTCLTHMPWCMPGSLISGFLWNRWRGKHSRHSRRMRNPQFCVSGKRRMRLLWNRLDDCFISSQHAEIWRLIFCKAFSKDEIWWS